MDEDGGASLQARIAAIAEAAGRRNPEGFVDRVAARATAPVVVSERNPSFWRLSRNELTPLEEAIEAGDVSQAQAIVTSARRELRGALLAKRPLAPSEARRLAAAGASVRDADHVDLLATQSDDVIFILALPALDDFPYLENRPELVANLGRVAESRGIRREPSSVTRLDARVLALRRLFANSVRVDRRERAMLKALGEWRCDSSTRWSDELAKEEVAGCREQITKLLRDLESARTHISQLEDEIVASSANKLPPSRQEEEVARTVESSDRDTSSSSCLVSRIRSERLADVDFSSLPEHLRVGAVGLRRSLAAATDRLATDLYDDNQTHFVYELLANADDASYDQNAHPTYEVHLDTSTSIFRSSANETGLSEADVEALCDVSRSNKDGNGTTGHKGIGFKSVFSVCDCPRIFSGKSLAIAFDKNRDGPLGLVTPSATSPRQDADDTTLVELFLRDEACVAAVRAELEGTFRRDATYILLFARRLRALRVVVDQELISDLQRRDERCVSLVGNRSYEMWRQGDIVLAFPLEEEEENKDEEHRRHFAHCVAPVEPIPFNFSIQAPFEVVASRNSIRHSSALNLKLRRDIRDAFLNAVAERPSIASRVNEYLASSTSSHFFWTELRHDLLDALADVACVPLDGTVVKPTECLRYSESTPEGRLLCALGVDSVFSSTVDGDRRRCRVVSCDPTDSLSLVIPEFKPMHLVSWLLERQQKNAAMPSTLDEEILFEVLLDVEPTDWPHLRRLKIIPTEVEGMRVALDDGLLALSTESLKPLSASRLAKLGIFSISEKSAEPFVLRHGGLESATLDDAYDHVVLRISSSFSADDAESLTEDEAWTALEIARRRGKPTDHMFKIPDQAGVLRDPDTLVSPLFLGGAAAILPTDVTDHLDQLLFGTTRRRARPDHRVAAMPPTSELFLIEWEAFFDHLGVRRRPAGSVAAEALVSAGAALSSVEFWRHISHEAAEYLADRLDSDPQVRAIARKLPADALGTTLDDLFARDLYAPIAGDALPYAFGAVENFPELGTVGFARRRAVLAKLINATFEPECVLRAAKLMSAKSSSLDVFAKLYGKCESLAKLAGDDWIATGKDNGLTSTDRCVWDDDPVLSQAAGSVRLAPLYPPHLQPRFEDAGVQRRLGSVTDCLAILRTIAQTDYSKIFVVEDPHSTAWSAARSALERIVASTDESARDATRNAFVAHRLVLVPRSNGGPLIALGLGEAFWDASPPASSFALSRHYPPSYRSFFVDFLQIQNHLQNTVTVLHQGVSSRESFGGAQQGLSHNDLVPSSRQQPASAQADIAARAIACTVNAVGELPRQIGTFLAHPSNYVAATAEAFGIPRRALAVSARRSCSFTFDGILVLSEYAAYSEDLAFVASEFAHGLAHNVSSGHDHDHGAAIQALSAFVLPRIAPHFCQMTYFHALWQQQQQQQQQPLRGRGFRGRGRSRGYHHYEGPNNQYF